MKNNKKIANALFAFLCLTNQMSAMEVTSEDATSNTTDVSPQKTYKDWRPADLLQMGKDFIEAKQLIADSSCGTSESLKIFPAYYAGRNLNLQFGKSAEDYYAEFEASNDSYYLAMAARLGLSQAQFKLGMRHYHNHMTIDQSIMKMYEDPNNFCVTFYLFTEAAQQDHPLAQCALGQFYYNGVSKHHNIFPFLAPNLSTAFSYFTLAAHHKIAEAHYMLGKIYEEGDAGPKDMEEAIKHYTIASQGEMNRSGVKEAKEALERLKSNN